MSCGIPLYTEVSSLQGVGIEVYRGVLISGGWNRGVPLYTEVSLFQGVGIERLHCIQWCTHYRGSIVYKRGVLISRGWNKQFHSVLYETPPSNSIVYCELFILCVASKCPLRM